MFNIPTKKQTYRILVLGETGSGKSTYINYLANYFLGGVLDKNCQNSKLRIVIPNAAFPNITDSVGNVSEIDLHDNTKSKTSETSVFTFTDNNGDTIEIVDTPGFADTTQGNDQQNIKKILKHASELDFLTAIILVINGSVARKNTTLKYVLNQMKGNIPDVLLDNLVIVFTNCDASSRNFDLKMLEEFQPKHVFHMQNNAFSISNNRAQQDEFLWSLKEIYWKSSMDTISKIMKTIKGLKQISSDAFAKMLMYKQALQKASGDILIKQKNLLKALMLLEENDLKAKQATQEADLNKNYTTKQKIEVIKTVKKDYFSTVCQTHYQEKICHENCGLALQTNTHATHFMSCWAHGGSGTCKQCSCSMTIHYHTYEIPYKVMEDKETVLDEMKAKYNKAIQSQGQYLSEVQKQQLIKQKMTSEVGKLKQNLIDTCKALKHICKNFNFHEELEALIETLNKEASMAHDFKARKEYKDTAKAIEELLDGFKPSQIQTNNYDSDSDSNDKPINNSTSSTSMSAASNYGYSNTNNSNNTDYDTDSYTNSEFLNPYSTQESANTPNTQYQTMQNQMNNGGFNGMNVQQYPQRPNYNNNTDYDTDASKDSEFATQKPVAQSKPQQNNQTKTTAKQSKSKNGESYLKILQNLGISDSDED